MDERPFRIVVASHGELAAGLVATARLITGGADGVQPLALGEDEAPEAFGARLRAAVDDGRPTLVLTDLRGGSPHNVASAMERDTLRCLSGVNLALLLEAMTGTAPLSDELLERLAAAGRDGIAFRAVEG